MSSIGIMEHWNIGILGNKLSPNQSTISIDRKYLEASSFLPHLSIIPLFQYSKQRNQT
jgi:hypothetical protein